ncbi:penicillin-binding protein 2 [Variovorax sp. IB41]|uniref:penicillin-binding protein 2 n=1 Tax=Variovorax sp. IB41 TaxID=2779370 RepID=UPI0018E7AF6F|nr:penicillin-binding protein 2 [Variovorax sp. IB41]MBJ2154906.1 penicillin-binding protein 2 [Variovorax sp. IB41]
MHSFSDPGTETARFQRRVAVARALTLICFGLIAARLFYLQVREHSSLSAKAERNSTAIVPIAPERGLIFDRQGVVLAANKPVFSLEITPAKTQGNLDALLISLAELVRIEARDIGRFRTLLAESKGLNPIPLRTMLSEEEIAIVSAQRFRFPGVEINARSLRTYPFGPLASHALGYIGRINDADRRALEDAEPTRQNYLGSDHIGKLGIEQRYEPQLHGTTGFERMETAASGQAMRSLSVQAARAGQGVQLALDIRLQRLVELLLGNRRGAAVVLDPRNGDVLSFASTPTFDPNIFVTGVDRDTWKALNESPDRPLLNRAFRGTYPPGSTYKPFMAMASLQLGKRAPGVLINDPGYWDFGNHRFRSHEGGLGPMNLFTSLVYSSNVYYYTLANEMGVETIHDFMSPFGFGQPTGIDLDGEVRGVLPNQAWKRKAYRTAAQQKWQAGETISLGIGQGYNNFTILQLATATAALANNGLLHTPRMVTGLQDPDTHAIHPTEPPAPRDLKLRPENLALVRDALIGVTVQGTARKSFLGARYVSAGKTGTAQAVTIKQGHRYNAARMQEQERDHGLYMGFAPAGAPRVAVAVIVENAGGGGQVSAPIARRIFDYLLEGEYPSEEDIEAVQQGIGTTPRGKPVRVEDVSWPEGMALHPDDIPPQERMSAGGR